MVLAFVCPAEGRTVLPRLRVFTLEEGYPCTERGRIFPLYQTDGEQGLSGVREIHKDEFKQLVFMAMQERFKDFQILHVKEEKVNPS